MLLYIAREHINNQLAKVKMAREMALEEIEGFVRQKIEVEKCTHKQLSSHLQQCYPGEKGFSLRSIERFCCEKGIRKVCARYS